VSWIGLISAILKTIIGLTNWMHDRQLIDAGTNEAVVKGLRDADQAIDRAQKARELVRAAVERDPAELMRDDGFKRPD
jgi:hypothetical protein